MLERAQRSKHEGKVGRIEIERGRAELEPPRWSTHPGKQGGTEASLDNDPPTQEYEKWQVHDEIKHKTAQAWTGTTRILKEKGCNQPGGFHEEAGFKPAGRMGWIWKGGDGKLTLVYIAKIPLLSDPSPNTA